jgi:hypothetical protein
LDVRWLAKNGGLTPNADCTLRWASGASIGYGVDSHSVTLSYSYPFSDGRRGIEQRIELDRTRCNYGGARPWFRCPRCWRRVAIIYLYGWPSCRACARLVYPSQSEDECGRSWRRTRKLEDRLSGGASQWNWRRPRKMRRKTFERLVKAYLREEDLRDDLLAVFAARYMHLL